LKSLLGLPLDAAKEAANEMGLNVDVIHYSTKGGVENADADIVIRQRQIKDRLELVVSSFKTKITV